MQGSDSDRREPPHTLNEQPMPRDASPAPHNDAPPAELEGRIAAREAGLRYVSDGAPGYRRRRTRSGFVYFDADGSRLRDREELARIAKLAIPPAYEDVWICANPRGHLQATGRDARGRKQYRYHPQWRRVRDGSKFARMVEFGDALMRLRRRVNTDLAAPGLSREKVLALIVRLLDVTRVRIGNDSYARSNGSFGLTTLHNRHLRAVGKTGLRLAFPGKGGLMHDVQIEDPRLAAIVRRCHQLPGHRLFQYLDEAGECHPVDSGQVNDYLRDAMGGSFTAKDFRTWAATSQAVSVLLRVEVDESASKRAVRSIELETCRKVAADMRNTPAVCRKSYIDPQVFSMWRSGTLHRLAARHGTPSRGSGDRFMLKVLAGTARLRAAA